MRPKSDNLITLIQASRVLDIAATRIGCTVRALRCVGMLYKADGVSNRITIPLLSGLIGCCYHTAKDGVNEARHQGFKWIEPANRNGGLRLTLEGARIAGILIRDEREARVSAQGCTLPKWPRAYVRKAVL